WSCCGGLPPLASVLESAIEKQLACAAAISSSGLVLPAVRSVREAQVTSCSPGAPLPVVKVPRPDARSPCQVTDAVLSAAIHPHDKPLEQLGPPRRVGEEVEL